MAHGVTVPRPQALENGRMFAVHGKERPLQFPGAPHDQVAARHQRLFVGKQHALAARQRRPYIAETGDADHGAEGVVRTRGRKRRAELSAPNTHSQKRTSSGSVSGSISSAATRGRNVRTSSNSFSAEARAVRHTTSKRSG